MEVISSETSVSKFDMETDISKLEAPTFTTIDRSNPASMMGLEWDHQVNLVGKKVLNPMIHSCDKCLKPILIYGRMIPCKHVFCLGCAQQFGEERICPRCGEKVVRVEQAGLGNIFLCTIGGSRYGNNGCRRTYLSSRDLQAHISHRHSDKKERDKSEKTSKSAEDNLRNVVNSISKASLASVVAAVNNAASSYNSYTSQLAPAVTAAANSGYSNNASVSDSGSSGMNISVLNNRAPANLITVHSQETSGTVATGASSYTGYSAAQTNSYHSSYASPAAAPAVTYPNLSQPPPSYSYSGAYSGSAASQATGYQYPAPSGYQSITAAPPPNGQTTGSSYVSSAGQTGGGAPSGGYGTTGGYGVAPGAQHWTRPPPSTQQSGYYRRL